MPREFVFDCPACEVRVIVDADIRSAVLEDGCVVCRGSVDTDAFVPRSVTETEVGGDTTG
jgi:hypothetical protein